MAADNVASIEAFAALNLSIGAAFDPQPAPNIDPVWHAVSAWIHFELGR
ncbi:hypothetical protein I6F30_07625 [Bradyrhizobium sp. NBAIM20]|nr:MULTISPECIES: hypothetical protein [unclassified Bradyrhizobium]MCA1411039.1 hypothetical protein [Bradyrhizobium sp. NBAIM20]MCA1463882.1 hypothetical protein [Bradyrhizobium sp. NBAIM18]